MVFRAPDSVGIYFQGVPHYEYCVAYGNHGDFKKSDTFWNLDWVCVVESAGGDEATTGESMRDHGQLLPLNGQVSITLSNSWN